MFIENEDDGAWLRDMPMWVVDTLLCLPDWIESENPDVQARLLPKAYKDDERDKEWRAALGESLEHLIATRTEIVKGDLQELQLVSPDFEQSHDPEDGPEDDEERLVMQTLFQVWIPRPHMSAWISTLQAGTHAIFILEGLTAEDVERDVDLTTEADKQVALIRLSILQDILVRLLDD